MQEINNLNNLLFGFRPTLNDALDIYSCFSHNQYWCSNSCPIAIGLASTNNNLQRYRRLANNIHFHMATYIYQTLISYTGKADLIITFHLTFDK